MIRFLLVFFVVLAVWYAIWNYRRLPAETRKKAFLKISLISLALVLIALVAAGRAHWIFALIGGVVAFAGRLVLYLRHLPMLAKVLAALGITIPGMASATEKNKVDISDINREDAAAILGVDASASDEEVLIAHKRLMNKIHPDKGGSDVLAAQINTARDVMLGK